jgi:type VI secretion system protein VasD
MDSLASAKFCGSKLPMHAGSSKMRLVLVALAWIAGGCAWFQGSGAPSPIDLTITAGKQLNPDEGGHALPTSIRIYQLKAGGKMQAAEFDQLYRKEKETLGEELLRMDELIISPGEKVRKQVPRDAATRAFAVVAVFRRPSGERWRVIAPLTERGTTSLELTVEDYRVERLDTRPSRRAGDK